MTRESRPAIRIALVILSVTVGTLHSAAQSAETRARTATATFAGGCFWCMEPPFDALDGVVSTTSGYTGGQTAIAHVRAGLAGRTGHTEAVQVVYDPYRMTYEKLLEVFWRNIDASTVTRSSAIMEPSIGRRSSITRTSRSGGRSVEGRIATQVGKAVARQIVTAGDFYPAEDYHQDYYKKNPVRYKIYSGIAVAISVSSNCGANCRHSE